MIEKLPEFINRRSDAVRRDMAEAKINEIIDTVNRLEQAELERQKNKQLIVPGSEGVGANPEQNG